MDKAMLFMRRGQGLCPGQCPGRPSAQRFAENSPECQADVPGHHAQSQQPPAAEGAASRAEAAPESPGLGSSRPRCARTVAARTPLSPASPLV